MVRWVEPIKRIASFYTYERSDLPMQRAKRPFQRALEKALKKRRRESF